MAESAGAAPSPKNTTTVMHPTTAEMTASVQMARSAFAASSLPRSAQRRDNSASASFRLSNGTLGTCQISTVVSEFAEARELLHETKNCVLPGDVLDKPSCDSLCGCAVVQESGNDLVKCQTSTAVQGVAPGFCYVDPLVNPGVNPTLVENCPATRSPSKCRTASPTSS